MVSTDIIEERMDTIEKRLSRLEIIIYAFLSRIHEQTYKEKEPSEVNKILNKFKDYFNKRNVSKVSREESENIRIYCIKIENQIAFTTKEYVDFRNLCQKMSEDIPRGKKKNFDLVVDGLLDIIMGRMISAFLSRLKD